MNLSVIVPTFNRPEQLNCCLTALSKQRFSGEWELVVVNDGGSLQSSSVIKEFKDSLNITYLYQENSGPATARNKGANISRGRYLVFLDDDCEPDVDWLSALYHRAHPGQMVGGKTINRLDKNLFSLSSQLIVTFLYEYFINTPWYFFTSNNFLVDRQSYMRLGGFNENFKTSAGEDREFCARWLSHGNSMQYEPRAIIEHAHYLTLRTFWKQHFKYGKAARQYGASLDQIGIQRVPFSLNFYMKLIKWPFTQRKGSLLVRLRLSVLLVISQLATALGFFHSVFWDRNRI